MMISQKRNNWCAILLRRLGGLAVAIALLLCSARTAAQNQSNQKVSVGVLPFDDASGAGIAPQNIEALARQLRAELIRSGKLTARMLALTQGTALPLEPEQASELGRAAKVDLVIAPTVMKAEAKPFQKGASSSRSVFGVQIGGAKATGVNAEVQIQVELIRASDGRHLDTFTVEGKKSSASVSTDMGGVSSNLGSADAASPNFQSSPLGQALKEAMEKLAGEVEKRSAKALANAPAASAAAPSAPPPGGAQDVTQTGTASSNATKGAASGTSASSGSGGGGTGSLVLRPFSADQIHTMGKRTTTGKVYATENAMRVEAEDKGKKAISILRFDRKVMWTLVPDQNMYVELPWASQAEWSSWAEGAQVQRESLGSEQVGVYYCDKTRLRVTFQGNTSTQIEWTAKELDGFVVKRQDEKGQWSTEYRNVELGPQDPSLFEVPAGYQKMSLGGFQKPRR